MVLRRQSIPVMSPQDMMDFANQRGFSDLTPPPMTNNQPIIMSNGNNSQPEDVNPIIAMGSVNKTGLNKPNALATLGSYLNAAGQGLATAPTFAQGVAGAAGGINKNMQNIRNFETMSPYYQQMGYDVKGLNPIYGGSGLGSTPESMINLQSQVDQRAMNNLYRQQLIQAQQAKQQAQPTVRDLMMFNPQFRQQMQQQFDFSGGKNADILDRPAPTTLLENMLPKNVNMRYSGGLNSTKTSKATITHSGGSGGGKSGSGKSSGSKPKLIY